MITFSEDREAELQLLVLAAATEMTPVCRGGSRHNLIWDRVTYPNHVCIKCTFCDEDLHIHISRQGVVT